MPVRAGAIALALVAAGAARAAAQAAVVYGTVRDSAGAPLEYVRVAVTATRLAAVTDAAGRYRLAGVPAGTVVLRAGRVGLVRARDSVTVTPGDSARVDFVLLASAVVQEAVVVTASKRSQLLDQVVTSVAVVTDSDLARHAVSTVDEAVNKAPGVLFLSGQVNIRGSSGFVEGLGSRVLLLVDGVPANEGDRGGIDWDMVPLEDVDHVEVVKGAGSSLYGSAAFGGVVNLITHEIPTGFHARLRATGGAYANPPRDVWRFRDYTGALGGLDATGSYGTPALRASFTVGGRHSDGYREQDRSDQWETAGKAEWRPAPGTRVTASGSWTSHQYDLAFPWCERGHCDDRGLAFQPFLIDTANQGAYTRSDKGYLVATLERTASAAFAWQARASWLRTHFTDVKPTDWGVANRFGAELRGTARSGADDRVVTVGAEGARADVTSDIFADHARNEVALYAEGEQRAAAVRLTAGARLDVIALDGGAASGVVSPRVGAVAATGLGTWRASVGRGFRAPSLAELFVSTQAFGYRVVPNPDLDAETAWSFELGDAAMLGARTRLDAALFWTEARRLIEPTFVLVYDSAAHDSAPAIQFRNVSRARLRGLDASISTTPIPRVTASLAYTFLDARDLASDSVLAFRPRHLVTLSADWVRAPFSAGADFRYVSRIERIELSGAYGGDPRVAAKVLDLRAGWEHEPVAARLLATNVLNYIYSLTPGTLEPVRTLSVILTWKY